MNSLFYVIAKIDRLEGGDYNVNSIIKAICLFAIYNC